MSKYIEKDALYYKICREANNLEDALRIVSSMPTVDANPVWHWIRVEDSMPEIGALVLACNPGWYYCAVANYAGVGVWMDTWHQCSIKEPTHWMPLPGSPNPNQPSIRAAGNGRV